MPGGKCASVRIGDLQIPDNQGDFDIKSGGARRARIELDYRLIKYRIDLAGVYDTSIYDKNDNELDLKSVNNLEDNKISWKLAKFMGVHPLFGKITVELQETNKKDLSNKNIGAFSKINKESSDLFPVINTNEFYFKIKIPRFKREYHNVSPLINSAKIHAIPPIDSLYTLNKPVKFFNNNSRKNNGEPSDWMNITKCWVYMPDQKFIQINVNSIKEIKSDKIDFSKYKISLEFINQSPKRFVKAYWFTLTDNQDEYFYKIDSGFFRFCLKKKKKFRLILYARANIKQPIVRIGAAITSNPITNNPYENNGAKAIAFDLNKKIDFLK